LPEELDAVIDSGAEGIGLYRTEYLYMNRNDLPLEEEQFENYKSVLERTKPNSVIIRTFDLGGDKFISHLEIPYEMNPFLGWRAIRFCLQRLDLFKVQLRAILRASVYGNLKLMYPMISNVDEFRAANAVVNEVKQELTAEGVPFSENFEIGAMIEIPSAALTSDILASEADFFSIGTNDLIQYTLAVERTNDRIAHLYKPCHPAVLRLIKRTIDEAHKKGIWVGICGEMAAEPAFSVLLMGMGMDELSISPSMVPRVKKAIRSLSAEEMRDLAEEALAMACAEEIEARAIGAVKSKLPELYEATD
jgi:phosphotransferase system enzyme I (PtsI)